MMMTRREALKTAALAATVCAATPTLLQAQGTPAPAQPGPFKLAPLPYPVDALEPHIDARTMEIHHDKHHAAYVNNLNKAVLDAPELAGKPVEEIVRNLSGVPEKVRTAIRNNGGGDYNHSLFWQMMARNGGGTPKGELAKAIEKKFGSFTAFKEQFADAALKQFGSGWAWLSLDKGELKLESSPNQDTPVSSGRAVVLGLDVWEHAYYLKYQNRRADYITAWWNVVNWDFVADRFQKLNA